VANSKFQSYFTGFMSIKILLYGVIAGVIGGCVMYKKTTQTVTQHLDNGYILVLQNLN